MGGDEWLFDLKMNRIQKSSQVQSFNCLIIGHSMSLALIPDIIETEFKSRTGEILHCFHFGLAGLLPLTAAQLTRILIDDYPIKLVIFGTSHLGFQSQTDTFESNPWLQYRLRNFNLQGWALDNFFTYRYYLRLRHTLLPGYEETLYATNLNRYAFLYPIQPNGYYHPLLNPISNNRPDVDLTQPPNPQSESAIINSYRSYQFTPKQLATLDQFSELEVSHPQLTILAVEMPFHPSFSLVFPDGDTQQQHIRQELVRQFAMRGLPYWTVDTQPPIPATGWRDRNHLNLEGAEVISTWLGQRLAQAITDGEIPSPTQ
jgi:hypothetical protein